jgi:hypothetical protein
MAKRVAFTDHAKADLRAIDRQTAIQILKTLARFAQSEEGDVKRLQGVAPAALPPPRPGPPRHFPRPRRFHRNHARPQTQRGLPLNRGTGRCKPASDGRSSLPVVVRKRLSLRASRPQENHAGWSVFPRPNTRPVRVRSVPAGIQPAVGLMARDTRLAIHRWAGLPRPLCL